MRIIPNDKFDGEACENLAIANDQDVIPLIGELLEYLQDLNWPVAGPVSNRLSKLGMELVEPLRKILNGSDDVWKYWIVSHFLHQVKYQVLSELNEDLNRIKIHPTKSEIEEEVYDEVRILLVERSNA